MSSGAITTCASSLVIANPWNFSAYAENENSFAKQKGKRKFSMQLNGGLIGVRANQTQLIDLASKYGFETVVALPHGHCSETKSKKPISIIVFNKRVTFGFNKRVFVYSTNAKTHVQ